METCAGEPLISMRPFAVTKCSAWLVSTEFPVSQAPSIGKLNLLQYCIPSFCRRLLTNQHTKTLELQNPLFPILWEDETNVQECLHMVK